MNYNLVKNWNKVVDKDSTIYHLGDFGDYEFVKKLNGKIILIMGNYEYNDLDKKFNNNWYDFKDYLLGLGFYDVIKGKGIVKKFDGLDFPVYMTHKPLDCKPDVFNLFGHIHGRVQIKEFGVNVGVDCNSYSPLGLSDIKYYKQAIENYYYKNVFCGVEDLKN